LSAIAGPIFDVRDTILSEAQKSELKLLRSLSDAQNCTPSTTEPRLNPQNGGRSLGPAAVRCQALEQCNGLGKRGRPSKEMEFAANESLQISPEPADVLDRGYARRSLAGFDSVTG
jgi:hypothetical protein